MSRGRQGGGNACEASVGFDGRGGTIVIYIVVMGDRGRKVCIYKRTQMLGNDADGLTTRVEKVVMV